MAQDIATDLYARISAEFENKLKRDNEIKRFQKKLENNKSDLADVSLYARRLGELVSETLIETLDEEVLPNGIMYWNIAEKTILPLLKRVHQIVNESAIKAQKIQDAKAGIGINSIAAEFPEERAKALIQKIADISQKEQQVEERTTE